MYSVTIWFTMNLGLARTDITVNTRVPAYVLAGALVGLLVGAGIHEWSHVMIFRRFGCAWAPQLLTNGHLIVIAGECPASAPMNRVDMANAAAEAVGYHLYLLLGVVGAIKGYRAAN